MRQYVMSHFLLFHTKPNDSVLADRWSDFLLLGSHETEYVTTRRPATVIVCAFKLVHVTVASLGKNIPDNMIEWCLRLYVRTAASEVLLM